MYKAIIILNVLLLVYGQYGTAQQNLVPNPGFELYDSCPNTAGIIDVYLKYWFIATPSPDYFNACSSTYGTPINAGGYQVPRTGQAHIGAAQFIANPNGPTSGPNSKEYFQIKLKYPLQAGKRYCVSFYINLVDSSKYAIKCMGALFTKDTLPNITFGNYGYVPQVTYSDTAWLDSKTEWVKISGSFEATGGEQFLSLGCFTENSACVYKQMPYYASALNAAYYFFDDVSVTVCDKGCGTTVVVPNLFTPNGDGINDVFTMQLPEGIKDKHLLIYNRWGNLVFRQTNVPKICWNGLGANGQQLSAGVYYYLLTYSNCDEKIISKNGFVHLFR